MGKTRLRDCVLAGCVSGLFLLALGARSASGAITFSSQTRTARYGEYDQATAFGLSQGAQDIDLTTTQTSSDFAPFSADLGSSFLSAGGGVSQHSMFSATGNSASIVANGFTYTGGFDSAGNIYHKFDIASQTLSVTFALAGSTNYSFLYNPTPTGPVGQTVQPEPFSLDGPGGHLGFTSTYPFPNTPYTYSGTLSAGTWTLQASRFLNSSLNGPASNFYKYSYDVDLELTPTPEPGALGLIFAGGVIFAFSRPSARKRKSPEPPTSR